MPDLVSASLAVKTAGGLGGGSDELGTSCAVEGSGFGRTGAASTLAGRAVNGGGDFSLGIVAAVARCEALRVPKRGNLPQLYYTVFSSAFLDLAFVGSRFSRWALIGEHQKT